MLRWKGGWLPQSHNICIQFHLTRAQPSPHNALSLSLYPSDLRAISRTRSRRIFVAVLRIETMCLALPRQPLENLITLSRTVISVLLNITIWLGHIIFQQHHFIAFQRLLLMLPFSRALILRRLYTAPMLRHSP